MNQRKLQSRTKLAAKIRDRHNPPYRVWDDNRCQYFKATTRAEARDVKREIVSSDGAAYIEQRTSADDLSRAVEYSRVR